MTRGHACTWVMHRRGRVLPCSCSFASVDRRSSPGCRGDSATDQLRRRSVASDGRRSGTRPGGITDSNHRIGRCPRSVHPPSWLAALRTRFGRAPQPFAAAARARAVSICTLRAASGCRDLPEVAIGRRDVRPDQRDGEIACRAAVEGLGRGRYLHRSAADDTVSRAGSRRSGPSRSSGRTSLRSRRSSSQWRRADGLEGSARGQRIRWTSTAARATHPVGSAVSTETTAPSRHRNRVPPRWRRRRR